jgi:hypothetical protein
VLLRAGSLGGLPLACTHCFCIVLCIVSLLGCKRLHASLAGLKLELRGVKRCECVKDSWSQACVAADVRLADVGLASFCTIV